MTTYAITCSREYGLSSMTRTLLDYFAELDVIAIRVVGAPSIFSAFERGVENLGGLQDDDVLILCHDDVNVMAAPYILRDAVRTCLHPKVGFLGPFGSRALAGDGSYPTRDLAGMVFLGDSHRGYRVIVGEAPAGDVLVLDGLFLMAQWKKIKSIGGLKRPDYLPNGWHFYDMHLTYSAHKLGYRNSTFPIQILHRDHRGEAGTEWFAACCAFIDYHCIPPDGVRL